MKNSPTLSFMGLDFYNYRYSNNHIIDYNHTWNKDITQFPGYPNSFAIELGFISIGKGVQEMANKYWHYSFYISIGYLFIVFGIKSLMKNRKPYNLQVLLALWNFSLASFSILGTFRCFPEFIDIIYKQGLQASCTKSTYYDDYRLSVWYLLFTLSKAIELFDTLFIVLRKSKLTSLHWIHHLLTLNYSWFVFPDVPSTARWMVNMNFFIHSLMYSYYGLKTLHFKIPLQVNITITILQVVQMFAGLFINYVCLKRKLLGFPVDISYSVAITGLTLYGLFAILFVNFFIQNYILPNTPINISYINKNPYKNPYKKVVKKCQ